MPNAKIELDFTKFSFYRSLCGRHALSVLHFAHSLTLWLSYSLAPLFAHSLARSLLLFHTFALLLFCTLAHIHARAYALSISLRPFFPRPVIPNRFHRFLSHCTHEYRQINVLNLLKCKSFCLTKSMAIHLGIMDVNLFCNTKPHRANSHFCSKINVNICIPFFTSTKNAK